MPVMTEWHDSTQNTIRIAISDPWTINDLSDGIRASRNLMASVEAISKISGEVKMKV